MNRTLLNVIIDLLATLSFLGMIATGYLLRFPLPPGSNRTHVLWGLTRHQWGDVHFWISIALLLIMLVHLALHWNWIVTVIGKRCGLVKSTHPSLFRCAIWTLVGVAALCIGFAWLAEINVKQIDHPGRGHRFGKWRSDSALIEATPTPGSEQENRQLAWNDVYPIFERNCLACHGPEKRWANFRADRLSDFFEPDTPWVVPGQPDQSPLIAIIAGERGDMPMADTHRLPDSDVSRIKTWIKQGARH